MLCSRKLHSLALPIGNGNQRLDSLMCVLCHCSSPTLDSVDYNSTIAFESELNQWNFKCLKFQCVWKRSWKCKLRSRILYLVTAQNFQPITFYCFPSQTLHRSAARGFLRGTSRDLLHSLSTLPVACSERLPKCGDSVTFPVFTWSHHSKRFPGLRFSCCSSES